MQTQSIMQPQSQTPAATNLMGINMMQAPNNMMQAPSNNLMMAPVAFPPQQMNQGMMSYPTNQSTIMGFTSNNSTPNKNVCHSLNV